MRRSRPLSTPSTSAITVLAPALGQHVFFLPVQHREPLDFLKIIADVGFGRKDRRGAARVILRAYWFRNEGISQLSS
jgi:hypothetical protein